MLTASGLANMAEIESVRGTRSDLKLTLTSPAVDATIAPWLRHIPNLPLNWVLLLRLINAES